jgi:hypothetical protein
MQKCVTCNFYDRRNARGVDGRASRAGQCRRSAPMLSPQTTKSYQIEGVWPMVRDDDWCGEWKILPRRPAMPSAHQAAVAAVASITALVAAAPADAFAPVAELPTVAMAAD